MQTSGMSQVCRKLKSFFFLKHCGALYSPKNFFLKKHCLPQLKDLRMAVNYSTCWTTLSHRVKSDLQAFNLHSQVDKEMEREIDREDLGTKEMGVS